MAFGKIYDLDEAQSQLWQLLERAHRGEEIILAKDGIPYAMLVPVRQSVARMPGLLEFRLGEAFFEPLSQEELNAWDGESPA